MHFFALNAHSKEAVLLPLPPYQSQSLLWSLPSLLHLSQQQVIILKHKSPSPDTFCCACFPKEHAEQVLDSL
jgi:hypothetical protein